MCTGLCAGAAFNAVAFGRKQWYLLPPSTPHLFLNISTRLWVQTELPKLGIKPIEFVPHAGEVHAFLTLCRLVCACVCTCDMFVCCVCERVFG